MYLRGALGVMREASLSMPERWADMFILRSRETKGLFRAMKSQLCILIVTLLITACAPAAAQPTITRTPRPTVQTTKTPFPTSTRSATPVSLDACVTDATIRVREGPGTDYGVIGGMVSGTCMSIQGRDQDLTWVYVLSDEGQEGWVAASLLTIQGDLQQVSVPAAAVSLATATRRAPTATLRPTTTRAPLLIPTSTPRPLIQPVLSCSDTAFRVGETVTCRIERADCVYRPDVNGSPTFCNDPPYPRHEFTLVVFGQDWSDLDGECILVSGTVTLYDGVPQIQGFSRAQVSYCQ